MGLLFKQILTADYTFEMDCWKTVSKQVRKGGEGEGRGGEGEGKGGERERWEGGGSPQMKDFFVIVCLFVYLPKLYLTIPSLCHQ